MKNVLQFNLCGGGPMVLMKNIYQVLSTENIHFDIASFSPYDHESDVSFFKNLGSDVFFDSKKKSNIFLTQIRKICFAKEILTRKKYDCIHIHSDDAYNCFIYGLVAKKCKVKNVILHAHSTGMINENKVKLFVHFILRHFLKQIGTTLVACSIPAAQWMFGGIDLNDVLILKNGIDLSKFKIDDDTRNKYRKKLRFDDDVMLIGHVGRFSNEKNHRFIINLLVELIKASNGYKLLLLGDGELKQEIEEYAKSKGIYDSIIFTGNVSNVQDYMQAIDLFILPSKFEGLPLTGVEAQACGLPVIFSTGVPKEAKITDNVKFIPTDNMDEWIKSVEEMINLPKQDNTQLIKSAGYDIIQTALEIERIYSK